MERELNAVQSVATDMKAQADAGSAAEFGTSIDTMIAKVEGLKRKVRAIDSNSAVIIQVKYAPQLSDLHTNSGKPTQDVMRERLQHLGTIESLQSTSVPDFGRWADTRLDRWLVDWTLRNGKGKTARKIAHDKNIEVSGCPEYKFV